jgi:hypothetical protein
MNSHCPLNQELKIGYPDHHSHACLQISLTRRRDAAGRQHGVAHDQPGAQPLELVPVEATIVVGQAIEVEVGHASACLAQLSLQQ